MTRRILSLAVAAALACMTTGLARAVVVTGSYDPMPGGFGKTIQVTPAGPWILTSTDATFSLLRRTVNEVFNFNQLTDVNVNFVSPLLNAQMNSDGVLLQAINNAGGGGGAPRLALSVDTDNDNISNGAIQIHLGNAPSYIDDPITLTLESGQNLLNNDPGRFDLSQLGGSATTNYAAALALVGNARVLRFTTILDSFGGADKTLEINSINAQFNAIPEASAMLFGALACCLGGGAYGVRRLRGRG
jgi:hypothetical protein